MNLQESPLEDRYPLPREEDLENDREHNDKEHGPQEAQEIPRRYAARGHERHERRRDEREAHDRVDEEQPGDERGGGHYLGPRVEGVHRRGDGIELPEARHLRPPAGPSGRRPSHRSARAPRYWASTPGAGRRPVPSPALAPARRRTPPPDYQ